MAGKVMNKMMEMLGMNDDNEEIEDVEEQVASDIEDEDISLEPFMSNKKPNKVVNIHTAASTKVVISKPDDYSEAVNICDNLKSRKIVVVNTAALEPKIGQKLLDFISGASYALDGEIQQVEKGVYILSPSNVEVSSDLKNELSSKGIFNWNK